jgi:hypothetical protein
VERFAGKNRGHVAIDNDRLFNTGTAVGSTDFTVPVGIAQSAVEFLETTLPYGNLITSDISTRTGTPFSSASPLVLNQAYWVLGQPATAAASKFHPKPTDENLQETWEKLPEAPDPAGLSREGSGGNYLSNEVFYRTALLHSTTRSLLPSGHLHIPPVGTDPQGGGPGIIAAVTKVITKLLERSFRMHAADITFPRTNINTTSSPMALTVFNDTNQAISIASTDVTVPFALQSTLPISVAAGASAGVQFTFRPTAVGVQTKSLKLLDSSGETLLIFNLTGEGAPTFKIEGTIKVGTTPLAGVQVALTGAKNASVTTGTDGRYSFPGLDQGASYTVTPTRANYTFSPTSQPFQQPERRHDSGFHRNSQAVPDQRTREECRRHRSSRRYSCPVRLADW